MEHTRAPRGPKPEIKPVRLVKVDCGKLHYHAYEGKKHQNTISSDIPLEPEFVEYFRVHTDRVMADMSEPDEPEVA